MKYDYEKCSRFIRNKLNVHLYPYQEKILWAFCEGKEVRCCRCAGRSFVAKAFGEYVASELDRNDYTKEPDVVVPFQDVVGCGVLTEKFIDHEKANMSEEAFNREYLCK